MTTKAERDKAVAQLREWLKPGDTVYTILRHVSRSGMSREIGCVLIKDGAHLHPNYSIAKALGERQGKRDGVIVGGCGMDMGFDLVYRLGYRLFPDGFGIEGSKAASNGRAAPKKRPATREEAAAMVAAGWTFHGRNGDASGWDSDGGYALQQRWL